MDLQTLLQLGERIDLRLEKTSYRSVVQDIPASDSLLALHPLDKRNLPIHLEYDCDIEVIFFRPNGQFAFMTRLESRSRVGNVAIVRLTSIGGEPERMQRRNSYRLPLRKAMQIVPIDPARPMEAEYSVNSIDISETGVQVEFPGIVGLGTQFDVHFSLEQAHIQPYKLRATISRIMPPEEVGAPWRLGLQFSDLPNDVRNKLAKYVFAEQLKRKL